MKVFLGANTVKQPIEARNWVTELGYHSVFSDLEKWALSKEAEWGDCFIFIEVSLPQAAGYHGKHNQIDILITFRERIAICELKQYHSLYGINLKDRYEQIDGQNRWLKALIIEGNYTPRFMNPFLFFSKLKRAHIEEVRARLVNEFSAHHVWVVGALPELKQHRNSKDSSYYLYLPEALDRRLYVPSISTISQEHIGLQHFLYKQLTKGSSKLIAFDNVDMAKKYLQNILPAIQIVPDAWYVPGARPDTLSCAAKIIAEHGIVELVGPPEIGKSTLAKELIQELDNEFVELRLFKCNSINDICRKIYLQVKGENPDNFGDESLIQSLATQPYVFWISDYGAPETPLEGFMQRIQSFRIAHSEVVRAQWIIESVSPLRGFKEFRCELVPLEREKIWNILMKVEAGGAFEDPDFVTIRAQGRPGYAIKLWQSQSAEHAKELDTLKWFRSYLTSLETQILPMLCFAASRSPLGLTMKALSQWATVLLRDQGQIQSKITESIESLLLKMQQRRLVGVTRLDKDKFSQHLAAILPDNCSMVVIKEVPTELIDKTLSSVDTEEQNRWQELLQEELLNAAEPGSLAHVTLFLNLGDLEPFLRSSFRFTFLKRLLSWIDETQWKADPQQKSKQAYILRALRIYGLLRRVDQSIDIETELGQPENGDNAQQFAYQMMKARTMLASHINNSFPLSSWLSEIDECSDRELQAEMYVATAMALQHSNRLEKSKEVWSILSDLWKRYDANSTGRCLALQQTLAHLNRTKVRKNTMTDDHAYSIVQELSRELLRIGMEFQNIQLVSDAIFYIARLQELRKGRTNPSEVLDYRTALRFIEEAQGRTVMRIQILLTQGSIHRHFCRQENIGWTDFYQNMEDGFACYRRAFKSALVQKHVLHTLNATSYMIDFCIKGLRFLDDNDARPVLVEKSREAVEYFSKAEKEIVPMIKGEEEQGIYDNARDGYVILLYLVTQSLPCLDKDAKDLLKQSLHNHVEGIKTKLKERFSDWKIRKSGQDAINRLWTVISSGQQCFENNSDELIKFLCLDLKRLLKCTRGLRDKKNRQLPNWLKMAAKTPAFSAYNLTPESRKVLLSKFQPKYERVIANHVTHQFGIPFDTPPPPRAISKVVGYACDEGIEAIVIEINGSVIRPDGKPYHLTISLQRNRKPDEAVALFRNGWQNIEPFEINVYPSIN